MELARIQHFNYDYQYLINTMNRFQIIDCMLLRLEGEIRLGYEGLYHITKVLRVNKVDSGIIQIAANQFAYN